MRGADNNKYPGGEYSSIGDDFLYLDLYLDLDQDQDTNTKTLALETLDVNAKIDDNNIAYNP